MSLSTYHETYPPAWGPIGREVYERTYSRTKKDGTQETWAETVERVVDGNIALAPDSVEEGERQALLFLIHEMAMLPAGRHLWASGADTTLGLFNCHRAGWDDTLAGHFLFVFDQLMLGGGVGANYSQDYLDRMPSVSSPLFLELRLDPTHPDASECWPHTSLGTTARTTYVIEDSREGWMKALELVIQAHASTPGSHLVLDASSVRPRGARIQGFGGIASGPGPLLEMLWNVNRVLNRLVGRHLGPMEAMEIDHEISRCVISGNVRRSARMSILHWEDPAVFQFIHAKADPSAHWSTNISVEVDAKFFSAVEAEDPHAVRVLHEVTEGMIQNGEPGFYNSTAATAGETGDVRSTNPCGEIALEEWEQCLLGHVNLAAFAYNHEGALDAFRLMTRYLLRATLAASSDPRQEAVKARNRRIGVGFFGFHDWALLQGVTYEDIPENKDLELRLRLYADAVVLEAVFYSQDLGIPCPIKTTTVAPTGSIAKLPGVSEGIQPPFSPYFVRRVRYASSDPRLQEFVDGGYDVEPDLYSPNTMVVSFPCRDEILDKVAPDLVKGADEIPAEAYLKIQAMVQDVYADNAISITINFHREDLPVDELRRLVLEYLPRLKGLTIMPEDGRPQSPYERMTRSEYEAATHHEVGQAFDDCSTGACPIR